MPVMQDRASGWLVEQVILSPPLLENQDMTSWQKKGEMCREQGWAGCPSPPGDRIRHKNWAEILPLARGCGPLSAFAHFSGFWGGFSADPTVLRLGAAVALALCPISFPQFCPTCEASSCDKGK